MHVAELTTDEQWDEAVAVLHQLWSHEDESFVRGFRDEEGYRAFGLYDDVDASDGDAILDVASTADVIDERAVTAAVADAGATPAAVLDHGGYGSEPLVTLLATGPEELLARATTLLDAVETAD